MYKLNYLSNNDHITVAASFDAMFEDRFNCHKCLNQRQPDHWIEQNRKIKGCYGNALKPIQRRIFGEYIINFSTCPGNVKADQFSTLWAMHKQSKNHGIDIYNLPARVYDALELIDNLDIDRQEAQRNKSNGKRNRG